MTIHVPTGFTELSEASSTNATSAVPSVSSGSEPPTSGPSRRRRSSGPSTRNRLGVDERRSQLLKLGQELFGSYSYDELSIDDIARAASISKGLLYHYFPSKRDYYVEVIRAAAAQLIAQTDTAQDGDSPLTRLSTGLDAYLDYVEEHAKPFASLLRSGIGFDPEVCNIVEGTRQTFLSRLLTSTPVSTPQMRNALRGWIGFAEGAVLDWIDYADVSRSELRALLLEMALHTVRTASEGVGQRSRARMQQ